jgi:uncharacterized protein YqgQ
METSITTVSQTPTGEMIQVRVNSMFKISILQIIVNFNPYNHIQFASVRILSIKGIRIMSGVCATGRNYGQFNFLLQKGADIETIKKEVKTEFENYFIKF